MAVHVQTKAAVASAHRAAPGAQLHELGLRGRLAGGWGSAPPALPARSGPR